MKQQQRDMHPENQEPLKELRINKQAAESLFKAFSKLILC